MDLRLLGPLEVRLDNGPIRLGARKQRAVLAMLALDAGRTVSVDRLAEGLWGEHPPSSAPKMVQLYVSHLRRALDGSDAQIVTRGRGYELQLADGELDVAVAERLVGEARAREALALWRGQPLADVADEPFAAAEIRRLEELRLRATEAAIDADLAAGRHAEVIGELDGLVAQQPLREHLHAQRILALYRSGRQSEALEAYREARAALVEQMGVEPGAELQQLHARVLAHDPALEIPAPAETGPEEAPRRPPTRRRTRALLVGAAACVLAGATLFGAARVLEPDGLPGIEEDAVGVIDPESGRITRQYRVGGRPSAVTEGGGSVWVASAADGTVSRILRGRGQIVTIPVGGAPSALAFGGGSLWVADGDAREVAQVDPGSNKVLRRIEVGNAPRSLAAAAGGLWVASGVDGRIRRVDLRTGRPLPPVPVGANPTALIAGAGSLWVASEESGTVTRLDGQTGRVIRAIHVGNGPSALAAGEGAIWVVNRRDGTLSRLDPERNAIAWTIRVGRDPTAVGAGGGAVWVAGGDDGTVAHVDGRQPRVIKRIKTGSSPAAITVAGGSVWASSVAPASAHRGGTLRMLMPLQPPVPINWLHAEGYNWGPALVDTLVYDGLVAYRRVEGVGGATLVGALATEVPEPSRDGRTYVFTLRPGLRYSDGRPVRPDDFRASMERLLRVSGSALPPLFAGIVGARSCVARPARCDLSRGIETDATARTITIHLTEPDAEFPHRLTLNLAAVVPADTPARRSPSLVPPGTGPYRVAAWDPRRGGVLVRNPRFRSSGDRPAGFADRIEVRVTSIRHLQPSIDAVQRGTADLTVLGNPFVSLISRDGLAALSTRAPGRVISDPAPTTDWMFLNVTRAPFDDLRVRQAVNLATDRSRLVALAGGAELAAATCQIVPRAFPGHEPYCPYTAQAATNRGWIAPDVERAHELVAASGTAGQRVVVRVPAERQAIGRYFVGLLRDLGFRSSLRVAGAGGEYFARIWNPASRAQMGFVGWGADYISPSTFIEPHFGCSPKPGDENASRLCDGTLTAGIRRARALPDAEAAGAWAATDRRVMDLAPAVPMTNRRTAILVSKRVGNAQVHPLWFVLLDQMWVR